MLASWRWRSLGLADFALLTSEAPATPMWPWSLVTGTPGLKLSTGTWTQTGTECSPCKSLYYICGDSNDETFSDVEDITEVLEVTVFDENRRTKHDFLGKVKLTFVYCIQPTMWWWRWCLFWLGGGEGGGIYYLVIHFLWFGYKRFTTTGTACRPPISLGFIMTRMHCEVQYFPGCSASTKDATRRKEMVQTEGEEYQEGCPGSSSWNPAGVQNILESVKGIIF